MSSYNQSLRTTLLVDCWRGRVWAACPAYVLRENTVGAEFLVPDGSTWLVPDRPRHEFAATRRSVRWRLRHATRTNDVLWYLSSTEPWGRALINPAGSRGSSKVYVSLQSPAAASKRAFVFTDWIIDVIVDPASGQHVTKDLDEWDQAVEAGAFLPDEQRAIGAAWESLRGRLDDSVSEFALADPPAVTTGLRRLHVESTADSELTGLAELPWEEAVGLLEVTAGARS